MTASLDARLKAGAQDIEYDGYSDLLREAASALAAERDRANRAEALLEEVAGQRDELASQLGIDPEWTEADA